MYNNNNQIKNLNNNNIININNQHGNKFQN